ncbi:MAG: glycosyltransferase [Myxococcales bacterium]|nr:glycosyltransferase [Myxococcales bacterium]
MRRPSISFVLLAYNEQDCIAQAISDCRQVGRSLKADYEVLVVDDGSSDRTKEWAEQASEGDVRVIAHSTNLGMGASMRDGYLAARCDYIAHLPGDRQVRAEVLAGMLSDCSPQNIVLTKFLNPPSGRRRAIMSVAFRLLTHHIGGLEVDFAGTYLFHRDWLERVDVAAASSDTFLFSFQLLELFRRAGANFSVVRIQTHLREMGASRVATPSRIARMFLEIGKSRMRS